MMTFQGLYVVTNIDDTGNIVTIDHSLPQDYNMATWTFALVRGSNFTITNNYIGYHRARGIILNATNGVIENNIIQGASMSGILITPEPDFSSNLLFSNNTISNTPVAIDMEGFSVPTGHQNISFVGNRIQGRDTDGSTAETPLTTPLISVGKVLNLTFTNNYIYNLGFTSTALQATDVASGTVFGNCINSAIPSSFTPIVLIRSPVFGGASLPLCQ